MFIALVIRLNILLIMAGTLTRILPYKTEMDGKAVFARTGSNFWAKDKQGEIDYTTISRKNNSRHQVIDNLSFAIDNRLNKQFDLYGMQHDINIGVDAFQEKVITPMINMILVI